MQNPTIIMAWKLHSKKKKLPTQFVRFVVLKAHEKNKTSKFLLFWRTNKTGTDTHAHTHTYLHSYLENMEKRQYYSNGCVVVSWNKFCLFFINHWLAFAFFICLRWQLSNIASTLCALQNKLQEKERKKQQNAVKYRESYSATNVIEMENRIKAIEEANWKQWNML